uniref:Gamma-aminobutyric acid type B receptor subunit 2-like n=1 Tax=Saccoglossus kowalevskii TaxID=10224 RepID=A0ABM0GMA5_SACKO|nr:PREDICTED: gamma-aminobutyric acid type B receptor subunit 2-like [Saccoglossus kowalevskii]
MLYDPSNATTITGGTVAEYYQRYLDWNSTAMYGTNVWGTPGYDSVWAVALALNNSMQEIEKQVIYDDNGTFIRYKRLEDFTYSDDVMLNAFKSAMNNVSFHGVTGPLQFDEHGERQGTVIVHQTQGGRRVTVALYRDVSATLEFDNNPIQWMAGPPVDGMTWYIEELRVGLPIYITFCVLASLGLVMALFFLVMNIVYRDHG